MNLLLHVEAPSRPSRDLRLTVEPTHTIRDLQVVLQHAVGATGPGGIHLRSGEGILALEPDSVISESGLVSGDTVVLGPAQGSTADLLGSSGRMVVVSGQDAGKELVLRPGRTYLAGRSPEAEMSLSDPTVARRDFQIGVAANGDVWIDPGPPESRSNPLRINGEIAYEPRPLAVDDHVTAGASTVALRKRAHRRRRVADAFGSLPFHRTPHDFTPIEETVLQPVARLPKRPAQRKFQVLTTLAPLLTGITMALVLGTWRYLLFAGMSPVVAAANWFEARRSGGKKFAEDQVDFRERLEARAGEAAAMLSAERAKRQRRSPDPVELVERCESHSPELWQRSREGDDFLECRVGVGNVTPALVIRPENDGDDEFRLEVAERMKQFSVLTDVPITMDLVEDPVVALVGSDDETDRLGSSIALQAVAHHSPEDLVIAAAVAEHRTIQDWLKWTPHVRSKNSPLPSAHLAIGIEDSADLIRDIGRLASQRALSKDANIDLSWPRLLFLVDREIEPDPSTIAEICDVAENTGISVVWMTTEGARIPRQAAAVAQLADGASGQQSKLEYVDPHRETQRFDSERVGPELSMRGARALCALRDASATRTASGVPNLVTLFQALEVPAVTPEWVIGQWERARKYSLPTRIGLADSGPVELDLVRHGPHGLIGGTSGAGKSELVQSLVANLLAMNSPQHVNVLFVDYKGGALSSLFAAAPHCVGAVTNLDALLALRALTSLKAELDRRMALFETVPGVKDLKDMVEMRPDQAPPSLVIVVDEFAALVRELPEFVDGIVSIAERGRSLGIHLLLSTQRPSGSINENIQQNTNLRISLRMLDSSESNNVIGTADAALIPSHMKGRGYARLGPGELIAFQSAWSGAPARRDHRLPDIRAEWFTASDSHLEGTAAPVAVDDGTEVSNQLQELLDAVVAAAEHTAVPPSRAPWMPPLTGPLSLGTVFTDINAEVPAGRVVTVGMLDDPAAQAQYPLNVDLGDGGGLLIYGNGGSGKTTALRTIAASAAADDSLRGGGHLTIFGLDFGSQQLGVIRDLPQCSMVAGADDFEAVTRLLALLEKIFDDRIAATAAAVEARTSPPLHDTVLVLIDGYDQLTESLGSGPVIRMQPWLDRLSQIISKGRQVQIYCAIASAESNRASGRLMNIISNRLVLRQTDDTGYRAFGIPNSVIGSGFELEPGQALTRTGNLAQIGVVTSSQADGSDMTAAFAHFARSVNGAVPEQHRCLPLPELVTTVHRSTQPDVVDIGLADLTHNPVHVDVSMYPFIVAGPRKSGRSTALVTIARQLVDQGREVWCAGPPDSPLAHVAAKESGFGRNDVIATMAARLAEVASADPDGIRYLIFDDLDRFTDMSLNGPFKEVVEGGVRLIGSTSAIRALQTSSPVAKELKGTPNQLALRGEDEGIVNRYQLRPGLEMPPGRGVLHLDGMHSVVQVAALG